MKIDVTIIEQDGPDEAYDIGFFDNEDAANHWIEKNGYDSGNFEIIIDVEH